MWWGKIIEEKTVKYYYITLSFIIVRHVFFIKAIQLYCMCSTNTCSFVFMSNIPRTTGIWPIGRKIPKSGFGGLNILPTFIKRFLISIKTVRMEKNNQTALETRIVKTTWRRTSSMLAQGRVWCNDGRCLPNQRQSEGPIVVMSCISKSFVVLFWFSQSILINGRRIKISECSNRSKMTKDIWHIHKKYTAGVVLNLRLNNYWLIAQIGGEYWAGLGTPCIWCNYALCWLIDTSTPMCWMACVSPYTELLFMSFVIWLVSTCSSNPLRSKLQTILQSLLIELNRFLIQITVF